MDDQPAGNALRSGWRILAVMASIGAVLFGAAMVLAAATLGSCSAFGGRCPQTPPPLLEDDVFGMSAAGTALAVGVPMFLRAPSRRRLVVSLAVALGTALLVGLAVRAGAHGG